MFTLTDNKTVRISKRIQEKLSGLSDDVRAVSSERCIFKVRQRRQSQIEEQYEPQMVSIGPYHSGKSKLRVVENFKLNYLKDLLHREGEKSLGKYVEALVNLEGVARTWYSDEMIKDYSEEDLVEMMLLDGCFILEFLRKIRVPFEATDEILSAADTLCIDLIGIENQVPFFILDKLFHMYNYSSKLTDLAQNLIPFVLPVYFSKERVSGFKIPVDDDQVIHLLDFVYKACTFSFSETLRSTDTRITVPGPHQEADPFSVYYINSASELHEYSGVDFEGNPDRPWLDITWEDGVVKIPQFIVHVNTERLLRNLIAYEQHYILHHKKWRTYITDYAIFLDRLMNSGKDVEVLRRYKIVINKLNDDKAVCDTFSRLAGDVYTGEDFCYKKVFNEAQEYANSRRHIWWTHLMRKYFNSPWSFISFLAASVALILTFLQTLYTIRPGLGNL